MKDIKRISTILWFALLLSQVIYVFVGQIGFGGVAAPGTIDTIDTIDATMSGLHSITAICGIFAGVCVHAFGIRKPLASGALDLSTASGQQRVFSLFIISWALCETAAVCGFIVRVLGAPLALQLQFAIPAAVAHLAIGPWFHALREKS